MTKDGHQHIASIERHEAWRHGDYTSVCQTGERITMTDGSVWLHPYSGAAPIQLKKGTEA